MSRKKLGVLMELYKSGKITEYELTNQLTSLVIDIVPDKYKEEVKRKIEVERKLKDEADN